MLNFGPSMTQGKKHFWPKMLILGTSQVGLMRGIYLYFGMVMLQPATEIP